MPAMVNYSGGIKNILSCCNVAGIKLIYTSELFVKKANLFEVVEKLKENGIEVINVENIKSRISLFNKLKALIESKNPLNPKYLRYFGIIALHRAAHTRCARTLAR